MKILNVSWCNNYGFVTIDNGYEVKTYMGQQEYVSEQENIDNIVKYGSRVFPEQLEKILSFYRRIEDEK